MNLKKWTSAKASQPPPQTALSNIKKINFKSKNTLYVFLSTADAL